MERDFRIPFLWFEFLTVEDASRGVYARRPSYRLVRPVPIEDDPEHGYRSRGEVFEELLSWQGMLPNPHQRTCTTKLKLHPAHALLSEWLGRTEGPRHAGHYAGRPLAAPATSFRQYRRNGGKASRRSYTERIRYVASRPPHRSAQRWRNYTEAPVLGSSPGNRPAPLWGPDAVGHVTLLGLRADEPRRVGRVMSRSMLAEGASADKCRVHTQPPGEHPCFPLVDWKMDGEAVRRFWRARDFDLDGMPQGAGNCVFCFMKGTRAIVRTAKERDPERTAATPSDIGWWAEMERKYRREVPSRDGSGRSRFGFFGVRGPTYEEISKNPATAREGRYTHGTPACDCTD